MRRIFTMLAVWFIPAMLLAQTTKTVEVMFSPNDFTFTKDGAGYYINSKKQFASYESDTLLPALPYIGVNVLLDADKEYDGFDYTVTETLCRQDFKLNPNILPRPTSQAYVPWQETEIIYAEESYPSMLVRYTGTHTLCGYKYASFLFSPFRYNATERKLYQNTALRLCVQQKASMRQSNALAYPSGRETVRNLVANPRDMESYREYDGITDYEYIIVTCDSLKSAFQRLADWKTTKGVPAKVLTTEGIDTLYTGATPQIRIKKALKDYYNGQHHGLRYVLLGGDVDIVPAQMCVIQCYDTGASNITPTDWFYGCLDDIDWDTNGNGYTGEILDSIDIAAELIVTRMSVSTCNDVNVMVERNIQYERNPITENWEDNILMCGTKYYKIRNTGNSDSQEEGETLYCDYIAPYWNGIRKRLYDTGSDFGGGAAYDFNIEHFCAELKKGYTFIEVGTHGAYSGFMMEDTLANGNHYYYLNEHADTLQNQGYSIVITDACFTNGFDYNLSPSLSESFMRNQYSGILAYIGSSRQGWVCDLPYSSKLDGRIYQKLFNSYWHQLGGAFCDAKIDVLPFCNTYTQPWRWLLFSVNMLGDPEMPVFLSEPQEEMEGVDVYMDDGIWIDIDGTAYRVCWMSRDDMGATLYSTMGVGFDASDVSEEISFCVRSYRHIPYLGVYAPIVHLQNETIGWNYHVFADETFVGRNVTNTRDEGDFVIESGKTTIESPQGVTIQNGFEVKLGAELEINVGNY